MVDKPPQKTAQTPEDEDRRLFKTYGGPITVDLIPQMQRTAKGEVIVPGYFNNKVEIIVVFAGRRAAEVGPLLSHLKAVESQFRMSAAAANRPPPRIDDIRMPVQIKGSWRHGFDQSADGPDGRSYQLVAARWAFADKTGQLAQFGAAPACVPEARTRNKSYILNVREFDAIPNSTR